MNLDQSKRINRRQALAASLGFSGLAALGPSLAMAQPRANGPLMGKRVLVGIGEFSEGLETYYMIYRLKEEGAVPVVVATKAGTVQLVVHDLEPQYANYTEKLGYLIKADASYADVKAEDFQAVLIPGGRGPEVIRQDKAALKIVAQFLEKDLPLGAMCHGPMVIYAAGSVKGRRMTAYYGIRADIELAGAAFVDEPAVVDRKMVTSRGWLDLPDFMPKFLEVMAGK